jgi:DNA-binding transcriptional regulator YiaG
MFRKIERFEEDGLGLPYSVTLIDAAEEEIDEAGNRLSVRIPNMEGMIAALAVSRATCPLALDGREVRFIRRAIGMTAKDFAACWDMAPESLSRWENGKQALGGWADMSVRLAAVASLGHLVPGLDVGQKDILRLRVVHREPDDWPSFTLRLVEASESHDTCGDDQPDWTSLKAA